SVARGAPPPLADQPMHASVDAFIVRYIARYPITSNPIDRAVPRTDCMADSIVSQFKSGSLSRAISSTCLAVTVPTFVLFGTPEPLAILAARLSRTAAGGVLVMNV